MLFKATLDLESSHLGSTDVAASVPKTPTVEDLKPTGSNLLVTIKLRDIQFKQPCDDGRFSSTSMSRSSQFDE